MAHPSRTSRAPTATAWPMRSAPGWSSIDEPIWSRAPVRSPPANSAATSQASSAMPAAIPRMVALTVTVHSLLLSHGVS